MHFTGNPTPVARDNTIKVYGYKLFFYLVSDSVPNAAVLRFTPEWRCVAGARLRKLVGEWWIWLVDLQLHKLCTFLGMM